MLDTRATAEIAGMLERLSGEERDRLVRSLDTVESLLDEGGPAAASAVALRAPEPGDLGWVVQRHGEVYAQEYGWDESFERLVARIVGEFAASEEGPGNRCWIATLGGRRAGCVFLMPGTTPGVGKLRLLLVEPWARGHGIGGRLVERLHRGGAGGRPAHAHPLDQRHPGRGSAPVRAGGLPVDEERAASKLRGVAHGPDMGARARVAGVLVHRQDRRNHGGTEDTETATENSKRTPFLRGLLPAVRRSQTATAHPRAGAR